MPESIRARHVTAHRSASSMEGSTMRHPFTSRSLKVVASTLLFFSVFALTQVVTQVATSGTAGATAQPPMSDTGPGVVSADALPTVQMNGVVWSQVIVGNTVYATGQFTSARPAGSPAGTNETPRSNILAYNLTTGALLPNWNPSLNAQGKTITASPDGTRIYVGGEFTQVSGVNRYRIAALNASTGALITSFNAIVDYRVSALVATSTTVYAGGAFSTGNGSVTRTRLAAFSASNGSLTSWAPTADAEVKAMVMTTDGSRLVVGGVFKNLNGSPAYGMGELDPVTGALINWPANTVVKDAGSTAAILTLTTNGTSIFGAGYTYGRADGNLEGTFSADPFTGAINWIEDCHGDVYGVWPMNGYVYTAEHSHVCHNVGSFPQSKNWADNQDHARMMAWKDQVSGTVGREPWGYYNWEGKPAPSNVTWFPDWQIGSYTGQNQAAWDVTGNGQYLVAGGEFLQVNGRGQQGIVRFAVRGVSTPTSGPRLSSTTWPINVSSTATGTARISFPANWDKDNLSLNYRISRDGDTSHPVYTTDVQSTFWNQPMITFTDTGLTPGQSYTYRVSARDADGNTALSDNYTIVAAGSGSLSGYTQTVMADNPRFHWRFGDAPGSTTAAAATGVENGTVGTAVNFGASPGAILGETDTAASFTNNSASTVVDPVQISQPDNFTMEAWVKTSSNSGGRIMGFSPNTSGDAGSNTFDRVLYMQNNGTIAFGVQQTNAGAGPSLSNTKQVITSQSGLNNNQWHYVVAVLGNNGMHLYIDGVRVASRGDVVQGLAMQGYWRVGADNLSGWANKPNTNYLTGQIDEPALYESQLSASHIANHYAASGRTANLTPTPADAYGAAIHNSDPYLYYRLGETNGSTANDSGIRNNTGDYVGTVGRNATGQIPGNAAANFTGNGFVASRTLINTPNSFSLEAWFNTTTTTGGKIIGFGDSRTGNSTNFDRHVYMRDDGHLVFGVQTGASNTITTPLAYNDGKWHQVVATQGSNGMNLYVDAQPIGTNPQVRGGAYSGYWRVGGDSTGGGSTSGGFNGRIDEAAVYDVVLTQATVSSQFTLGGGQAPNVPPTAAFTANTTDLTTSVDASTSSDSDGTIVSYAWDFGDGATATGVTATHPYATAGTYTVKLTVTDNQGATGTASQQVTATAPNQPPTAAFTYTPTNLTVAVDGSTSSDPDGTIASYAWDFGDGATATGVTATHPYATAGTYTVKLTVTDNKGATNSTSQQVTVTAPVNQPPVAAFTYTPTNLSVAVDGSTSHDPDGTIASYAWDFGDGATATGVTASHPYATAGTYTVALTVTDNLGATNSTSQQVTVTAPVNQPPVAAFTYTPNGLTIGVDGSTSHDPDGTIASYAWDFGDGATATGVTASHPYATAGTYTVALTVTDNLGATNSTSQQVTVVNFVVLAADTFSRTVTNGFGAAETGGTYILNGTAANFAVNGGMGRITVPTLGASRTASTPLLSTTDVDARVDLSLDSDPSGGGAYLSLLTRRSGNNDYRVRIKVAPGATSVQLLRNVSGTATTLASQTLTGVNFTAGRVAHFRLRATGSGTTTLQGKVWFDADPEPATWNLTTTDTTAGLQTAGGVGVEYYLSGSATTVPATMYVDNLQATTA
jgi:PKD repeat protein